VAVLALSPLAWLWAETSARASVRRGAAAWLKSQAPSHELSATTGNSERRRIEHRIGPARRPVNDRASGVQPPLSSGQPRRPHARRQRKNGGEKLAGLGGGAELVAPLVPPVPDAFRRERAVSPSVERKTGWRGLPGPRKRRFLRRRSTPPERCAARSARADAHGHCG